MVRQIQSKPRALLIMGCPEVPIQTSLVLFTSHLLVNIGCNVLIAGTQAALNLIKMADPEGHYVKETADLDTTIGDLAQKILDPDICYVFIHNDAGVSYLATASVLISGITVGIIFGHDPQVLVRQCSEANLTYIWARAVHNPVPLESKIKTEVDRWSASMS